MNITTRDNNTYCTPKITELLTIMDIPCIKVSDIWNEEEQTWEELLYKTYIPKMEIIKIIQ